MKIKIDVDNELLCKLYACKLYIEKYSFESINDGVSSSLPFSEWINKFAYLVLADFCEIQIINIKEIRKELPCHDE